MTTSERYPIPATFARMETRVINSRFIGSADYTPTVDDAKAFIARIREEFPDATHHVYAFLAGYGTSVTAGMSDDGEPSGTGGRPMLAVLQGSGLGDITVVATRYFGGTLLGTGGLVRAYSDITKAVLDILPRSERIPTHTILLAISYSDYTPTCRLLDEYHATILSEEFAADVTITASIPITDYEGCAAALSTLTAGQAELTIVELS